MIITVTKKLIILQLLMVGAILSCKKDNPPDPQLVPIFGPEQAIVIDGYSDHAMEPFISRDDKYLFFNNLNDGINTSLHYAEKVNDTLFTYKGEIAGVNGTAPHLDAVASMDKDNNFYFISTRNYPGVIENLQSGSFSAGAVADVKPVNGNFYIDRTGWIVMDAEINNEGGLLYYANAKFTGEAIPTESKLGLAERSGSDFKKVADSDKLLKYVNDVDYVVYAPSITNDGFELYFTRFKRSVLQTEICVSVRSNKDEPFSEPVILLSGNSLHEAPTLASDKKILYYHRKENGVYRIFMRYRN